MNIRGLPRLHWNSHPDRSLCQRGSERTETAVVWVAEDYGGNKVSIDESVVYYSNEQHLPVINMKILG